MTIIASPSSARMGGKSSFPEVLDSAAVALLLKVHLTTVQELARRGDLPGRKVGKDYRFFKEAVVAWLSQAATQSVPVKRGRR